MAELMITVAILVVLAALAFIGVSSYMKNMHQLEMDAIAKEIFITAQNHLSMADSQGFPNVKDFGYDSDLPDDNGVYYYIVTDGTPSPPIDSSKPSLLSLLLPYGAIDSTVIGNGSFIIRYQKAPAVILDVFYASTKSASFFRNYQLAGGFTKSDYYLEGENCLFSKDGSADKYRGGVDPQKSNRKNYRDGSVIGWYGGDDLKPGADLKAPTIEVINAETLRVKIKDNNDALKRTGYKVQLLIRGITSNGQAYISWNAGDEEFPYTLDDICKARAHFAELFGVTTDPAGGAALQVSAPFIPGENISVQAKVFSSTALTNVATSELLVTNSLFDTGTTVAAGTGTPSAQEVHALISNIRHLENLSKNISKCGTGTSFYVADAVQTKDLTWGEFRYAAAIKEYSPFTVIPQVRTNPSASLTADVFLAVEPGHALKYDGGYHTISPGVTDAPTPEAIESFRISEKGDAGLFSKLLADSSVKNLELVDFAVAGTTSAGALAGTLANTAVTNVIARNSGVGDGTKSAVNINATAESSSAGGLIGNMSGGTATNCAAAVIVNGTDTAGGLIGTASGTITGCYSGGHTKDGSYTEWVGETGHTYDVTGATAGGLIGKAGSSTVSYCYSTCSVSGIGDSAKVGGFVGDAESGSFGNCYCTGLVTGKTKFAFSGTVPSISSQCRFYEIINEDEEAENGYLLPYPEYSVVTNQPVMQALDHETSVYNTFVGGTAAWTNAAPYDAKLTTYYHDTANAAQAKYNLRSIPRLGSSADPPVTIPANYYVNTHYGDWPAPEIFIINN